MPPSRRESAAVLLVSGLGVAMALGLAGARGALGIPRNDDWVHARDLFRWVASGRLELDPWTGAMTWGQLAWARPLVDLAGPSHAVLQVATAVIGLVGLLVLHRLLRPWAGSWAAGVAVAVTALGPLFAVLAASYMGDVPAMTLQVLALWLASRALATRPAGTRRWWAALLVALGAFTIREYAAAVVAALAVAVLLDRRPRRETARLLGSLAGWVLVAGVLWTLRTATDTDPQWGEALPAPATALAIAGRGLGSLGLLAVVVLPWAVLALLTSARSTREWAWVAVVVGLVGVGLVAGLLGAVGAVVQPTYVARQPAYWNQLAGEAPAWLPWWPWRLATLGAAVTVTVALGLAALVVWRTRGRTEGRLDGSARAARRVCLSFLGCGTVLVLLAASLRGLPAMDRYFLPLAPFLVAAVLSVPITVTWARRAAAGAVAGLVALWTAWGVLATDVAAANDALRWSAGSALVDQGWRADRVDAGYEWWGAHHAEPTRTGVTPGPAQTYWSTFFPATPPCVRVAYAGDDPQAAVVLDRTTTTLSGLEIRVVATPTDTRCVGPAAR